MANNNHQTSVTFKVFNDEYKRKIKEMNSESSKLRQEFNLQQEQLKHTGTEVEKLTSKINYLERAHELARQKTRATETQLERARQLYGQNSVEVDRLERELLAAQTAEARLANQLTETNNELREQTNRAKKLGETLQNTGQKMKDVGSDLTMKLTTPLVGLGTAATMVGAKFEQSMSNVAAISGATGKDFELLEAKAREMGATTNKSASEAADALSYMALAGWDTQQMIGGIEPILKLSSAGNIDLARTSDLVTDSMAALQLEVKDLPNFLDMVAKASQKSNTNVDALMEAFLVAGGNMASFNVPLEEATSLLGILANRGYKGAEAGTAMNAIFTNLTSGLGTSGKAMKKLGLSAFDSKGNFKGLENVFLELKEKLEGMTEKQQAQYVAMIAGKEHLKTFQAIMAGLGDEYGDLKGEISSANGALQQMYDIMTDNLKGRWDEFTSALEEAGISIFKNLQPALEKILGNLQMLVDRFNNLSPVIQHTILIVSGIAAAIGPLLVIIGTLVNSIGVLIPIIAGISAPVLAIIAGLVAFGVALVALWRNSETFRNGVTSAFLAIKELALNAFEIISKFIQEKLGAVKSFWDENGSQFLEAVENVFNGIMKVIDFVMPAVLFIIDMVWTAIKQIIDGALNVIMGLIKVFTGIFTGDFSKLWEGVKQIFFGAIDVIIGWMTVTFVGGLRTLLTNLVKLGLNLVKNLASGIVNLFKSFTTTGTNLANGMVNGVINFFRNLYTQASNIFGMLRTFGASVFNAMSQAIIGVAKNIFQSVVANFTKLLNAIRNIFGTTKSVIVNIWNGVLGFFKGINLTNVGKDIIRGLVNGIGSMASAVWDKAKSIANGVVDSIKKTLGIASPSKVTTKLGEETGIGFANGISKKKKDTEKAAKANAQSAAKKFKEALDSANYNFKIGKVDAEEHIKSLKKVRDNYAKTPEQVRKVNLAILEIEKKHAKDIESLQKAKFDYQKDLIEKKKQMNELSLTQELAAWERVQNRYKVGSKEREEAEQNVYRIKKEIHDKLISLNDEYTGKIQEVNQKLIEEERALNDEYRKAIDDRARTLYSFAGIFDEIKVSAEVSGQQLIDNLRGQVVTFAQWSNNIRMLARRGIDEGLLNELRDMGPKAASEIAALNSLTDDQLQEYASLWKAKNQMAREQAVSELEGLKRETAKKIDELHTDAGIQLDKLKKEWQTKIKQIRQGTTDEFNAMKSSMTSIGKDAMTGMLNGLSSMEGTLKEKAKSIADAISSTVKNALKIKSPSRVMMGIGEDVSEGLAIGIERMKAVVANASASMAEHAIPSGLKQSSFQVNEQTIANSLQFSLPEQPPINLTVISELDGYQVAKNQFSYMEGMLVNSHKSSRLAKGMR